MINCQISFNEWDKLYEIILNISNIEFQDPILVKKRHLTPEYVVIVQFLIKKNM